MTISVYLDDIRGRQRLRLAPADIEEALCRCGWTMLNDAEDLTDADRAELARIRARGYAESPCRENPMDSLAWWKARVIPA